MFSVTLNWITVVVELRVIFVEIGISLIIKNFHFLNERKGRLLFQIVFTSIVELKELIYVTDVLLSKLAYITV